MKSYICVCSFIFERSEIMLIEEGRKKIPISKSAELFVSPTIPQSHGINKVEDYRLKNSMNIGLILFFSETCPFDISPELYFNKPFIYDSIAGILLQSDIMASFIRSFFRFHISTSVFTAIDPRTGINVYAAGTRVII